MVKAGSIEALSQTRAAALSRCPRPIWADSPIKLKMGGMLRKGMPWSFTPIGVSLRSAICLPQGLLTAAHALLHKQGIGGVGLVASGKPRVLGPLGETQAREGAEERKERQIGEVGN